MADNRKTHVFCVDDDPMCASRQSRIRPRGYALIMAGCGEVPTAVRAIKAGRADFLQKSM
ncbi:MAG: hypothetical protein ACYS74_21045 [Planctomycetota bacterium]